MKKFYGYINALILVICLIIPAFASTQGSVTTLQITEITTESITIEGTTQDVLAAVTVQVLDKDKKLLTMESTSLEEGNKFSHSLNSLSLTEGETYTVRAADYDGGKWKTITVTVPTTDEEEEEEKQSTGTYNYGGYVAAGHKITSDLKEITKVTVDGKVVSSQYYSVSQGNVTLYASYLATLSDGSHTVKLYNGLKTATTTIQVKNHEVVQSAQTGDSGIAFYVLMTISSSIGTYMVIKKKQNF